MHVNGSSPLPPRLRNPTFARKPPVYSFPTNWSHSSHSPMNIKNVDIICPELLQTVSNGYVHALGGIPCIVTLQWLLFPIVCPIPSCVFCCNDHLIPVSTLLHPFPNKPFRVLG